MDKNASGQFVLITPAMAKDMLSRSLGNRTISAKTVGAMAADMLSGDWKKNAEPIQFDNNNKLRNGHHRLTAIVKANLPQEIFVVTGLDPDECTIYDRGRGRTIKDTFAMMGVDVWKQDKALIGMVRLHYYIQYDNSKPSDQQVLDFIDKNEKELIFLKDNYGKEASNKKYYARRPAVLYAAFCGLKNGVPAVRVGDFLRELNSGVIQNPNESSVIKLRNMIIDESFSAGTSEQKRLLYIAENALYDFCKKYPRKKSYFNSKPIYSNTQIMKEAA